MAYFEEWLDITLGMYDGEIADQVAMDLLDSGGVDRFVKKGLLLNIKEV